MRRPRILLALGVLLVIAIAAGAAVYQRYGRPSRTVLLLPDGDLVLYVNVTPAPFVNLAQSTEAQNWMRSGDLAYQDFEKQTDFRIERDLDEVAVSQSGEGRSDLAAVFSGRFDAKRLEDYLQRLSIRKETYDGKSIFVLNWQGELSFVSIVDPRTVAFATTQPGVQAILDKALGPSRDVPALVRDNYQYVPFASVAWAMVRVSPGTPGTHNDFDFLDNTTSVLSVRYLRSLRVRANVIAATEAGAANLETDASKLLDSLRQPARGGSNDPRNDVFNSIRVERSGKQVIFHAVIPTDILRQFSHF